MPIVKLLGDMLDKYAVKYSGENVKTVLEAIKTLMDSKYEASIAVIYDVVERARGVLDAEGVPSIFWGVYLSFAQRLAKRTFSLKTAALQKEASALKAEWVTAHGADPDILDKIINVIIGTVPPY